jgi:hypothetical protein
VADPQGRTLTSQSATRDLPWATAEAAARGTDLVERAWSPEAFHALATPTDAICNLGCSYYFFLDKEQWYEGSRFHMPENVLDRYIRHLIEAHSSPVVTVAWQGSEPTLVGLDFFRREIETHEKYRRLGMTFENTIQTNGTLLTDDWCDFLKNRNFLVGISMHGLGLNHMCARFKNFFHHVDEPICIMADASRSRREASAVMPVIAPRDASFGDAVRVAGRNDPCPCGAEGRRSDATATGEPAS